MGYQPECSYFVTIEGSRRDIGMADALLTADEIVPDYIQGGIEEDGVARYEVEDGTIPKWTDVERVFTDLSKNVPVAHITVEENNEEDHSESRVMIFQGGMLVDTRYSRTLAPDEEFDKVTLEKSIKILQDNGHKTAAALLQNLL